MGTPDPEAFPGDIRAYRIKNVPKRQKNRGKSLLIDMLSPLFLYRQYPCHSPLFSPLLIAATSRACLVRST